MPFPDSSLTLPSLQVRQETMAEEIDRVAQMVLKEFKSFPDAVVSSLVTW